MASQTALPTLTAFVESYASGPAGLLELPTHAARSERLHAKNAQFTSEHAEEILKALNVVDGQTELRAAHLDWTIACLGEEDSRRYAVCLAATNTAPRSSADDTALRIHKEKPSSNRKAQKDWLDVFSTLTVPGLARKDALAHIELLRRIDWENTSLGPISTWSQALQSAVGMCLASPFPVLLAWGPDLVSELPFPISCS
jgi:hypothetical protein